jgi:hypothetical protein
LTEAGGFKPHTKLNSHPRNGVPSGIRTHGVLILALVVVRASLTSPPGLLFFFPSSTGSGTLGVGVSACKPRIQSSFDDQHSIHRRVVQVRSRESGFQNAGSKCHQVGRVVRYRVMGPGVRMHWVPGYWAVSAQGLAQLRLNARTLMPTIHCLVDTAKTAQPLACIEVG